MNLRKLLIAALLWAHAGITFARADEAPITNWSTFGDSWSRTYVGFEYLLWWMKPVCLKVPTLTEGSPADAIPGAFGQPNTRLLAGASRFEFPGASGIRPRVGMLLSSDGLFAVEAEGFLLETATSHQNYDTRSGTLPTFIPYIAPNNTNQALPFSRPGVVDGTLSATGTSQLWGAEINGVANILSNEWGNLRFQGSVLAGVRYLELQDGIALVNTQVLSGNPNFSTFGIASLKTRNQFYGVQLGERLLITGRRGSLEFLGKLAVGETDLGSNFSGNPLVNLPVQPGLIPGPINVLSSNAGSRSTYRVTFVPEIGTKLRLNPTDRITVSLGYSLIYWNRILCPGDLMDAHVNPTLLPFRGPATGPALPALQALHTDYFAHGINAGFEFRF